MSFRNPPDFLSKTTYRRHAFSSSILSLPFAALIAGLLTVGASAQTAPPASLPIEHVIVVMQENRSFDHYFGALNLPEYYGNAVDGLDRDKSVTLRVHRRVQSPVRVTFPYKYDAPHSWRGFHYVWNDGLNNGFRWQSLTYFGAEDLPYYYALANTFSISDRYFASVMAPTLPNRYFLWCGTAFGRTNNVTPKGGVTQRSIFDSMNEAGVSWKYYADGKGYLAKFPLVAAANTDKQFKSGDILTDMISGTLPSVSFIDADAARSEHPPYDPAIGQAWVRGLIDGMMNSPYWGNTVLFLTYDESGGFYDHVAPPPAVLPDAIDPIGLKPKYTYDRLGYRVPFVAVSAYTKRHFVSHVVLDHTSILKFIETRFDLPALTARDAAAHDMSDLFDFAHPDFSVPNLPVP